MSNCKWCGDETEGLWQEYCCRECNIASNEAKYTQNKVNVNSGSDAWFIGLILWIIAFYGEPDLVDAIIHYLMK